MTRQRGRRLMPGRPPASTICRAAALSAPAVRWCSRFAATTCRRFRKSDRVTLFGATCARRGVADGGAGPGGASRQTLRRRALGKAAAGSQRRLILDRGGETLGIVGESGSGKTTVGRCVLRLIEPTSGRVFVGEQDLAALSQDILRVLRPKMQLVFQEPFDSLDPQKTVGRIIAEPLRFHTKLGKGERDDSVIELLTKVGLSPETAGRYPHQMAAGQQQRVGIARAIATEPGFMVLDEPVSSLDPTARAEIIDLLIDLQERSGSLTCSSRTISRQSGTCATGWRSCISAKSSK